jgi:hypothetical protein
MSKQVVIIVPSQGASVDQFVTSAKLLKVHLYSLARIVQTVLIPGDISDSVDLVELASKGKFTWNQKPDLDSVLTITHGAPLRGPNLTYAGGRAALVVQGSADQGQPWGSDSENGSLSFLGRQFWGEVGRSLKPKGKIIMLGCKMGLGTYAQNVAREADHDVYASTDDFGAGHPDTVLRHVTAIERGGVLKPIVKFNANG